MLKGIYFNVNNKTIKKLNTSFHPILMHKYKIAGINDTYAVLDLFIISVKIPRNINKIIKNNFLLELNFIKNIYENMKITKIEIIPACANESTLVGIL